MGEGALPKSSTHPPPIVGVIFIRYRLNPVSDSGLTGNVIGIGSIPMIIINVMLCGALSTNVGKGTLNNLCAIVAISLGFRIRLYHRPVLWKLLQNLQ